MGASPTNDGRNDYLHRMWVRMAVQWRSENGDVPELPAKDRHDDRQPMNDWTKIDSGTFNGVSITSEGSVTIPSSVADSLFGDFDRAAAYVNGSKVGIRVGTDVDTTYKIRKDHNRHVVNCAAAVRAVMGSLPDSAERIGYTIKDTERGKMLVIDLAELNNDDPDNDED